ncbi:hypothetical protein ACM46_11545 [Chryseobacterium angstadtii]|uniref:Uncharacterized protein n=1 Tax=Chryseobacterium angstadtii TaxID=558151 RepID=A0A0J7IFD9_9FLAO|nr:hypothetical protein [Chryseobacterium angstadtii]KMQ64847.1 hypothetical protein ACM46_11545 [Chryseobacterium angstadtii]
MKTRESLITLKKAVHKFAFKENAVGIKRTYLYNSIFVVLLSIVSLGCQKSIDEITEQPLEKSTKSYLNKNTDNDPKKMLAFETLSDYEKFFNDPEFANKKIETTDYSPLRNTIDKINDLTDSQTPDLETNPIIEDEIYEGYGLLLDILNQKKLVELGNYIVRVDLAKDKIYTIPKNSPNAVDVILNSPTDESLVASHDPKTELISFLFNFIGCNDRWAQKKQVRLDSDSDGVYCSNRKRTKKELTYQSAGIYFSIVGEAKGQKRTLIWFSDNSQYPDISYFSYTFKRRCGSSEYWGGDPDSWGNSLAWSHDGNKATFRPYQSTYALKEFNVYANIVGCGGSHTLHIEDY